MAGLASATRVAALAFAAALAIAGCGGAGTTSTTVRPAASAFAGAPCPAPYLAVSRKPHDNPQVRAALAGRFRVHGFARRLSAPVNWAQDPFHSRGFRGELASLKWLDVLIYAYRQGNIDALAQARDLALNWIRNNPRSDPGSDKSWEDKIVGDRAPYLAYIARASSCEGILSRSQGRDFLRALRRHGRALASPSFYTPTNHGLFMDYGLTALAREAPEIPGASSWLRLAPRRFEQTLLGRVYRREGMWLENSSSYHLATLELLGRYLRLAGTAAPASLRALATRMRSVAGWLIEPDGKRVLLGDSNLKRTPPPVAAVAKRTHGLLWLPRSGIAVVKKQGPNPSYLLFAATFHNSTHNQADALTFDLFANGHRVTSDSGLYDKDPDPLQVFSRSAFAHSVMTIDGQTFPLGGGQAYGSGLRAKGSGAGWYALEGTNPLAQLQGVTHERLLLYRPGYALVVCDFAASSAAHSYSRYFQLGPDLHATRSGGQVTLTAGSKFVGRLTWTGDVPTTLRLWRGNRHPPRGLIFPHYRKAVPRTTAELTSHAANMDATATFALDRAAPVDGALAPGSTPAAATVELTRPGHAPTQLRIVQSGSALNVSRIAP